MNLKIKAFIKKNQRKMWVMPVIMGIMLMTQTARHRSLPARDASAELGEPATRVRAMEVKLTEETPWIEGFGTVKPARVWHAVADVSGRIVEVYPSLKEGALVAKGEVLLRIDESSYKLTFKQQKAALAQVQASLEQLRIHETNDRISLKTENHTMGLYRKDLKRYKDLLSAKAVSHSDVDRLERAMLVEQQKVQNLKKALSTVSSERASLKAQIMGIEAAVEKATLDIQHCVVTAPYDGRISGLSVELSQFVTHGKELLRIDDSSSLEINVQVGLDRIASLGLDKGDDKAARAVVYFQGSRGKWFQWPAQFSRNYNRVDPKTRTAGVVVTVNEADSIKGDFPLVSGIYCQVRLMGQAVEGIAALPRETLHGNRVYTVTSEDRLLYQNVEILDGDGELVLVRSGLEDGELVVLSDISTAIPGMKLDPVLEPISGERS